MNELQELVLEIVEKYNLETSIEARFIDLTSEVGEIGKELLIGSCYGKNKIVKTENLDLEIGDTLFSLISLSNTLGININNSLKKAISKYEKRFKEKGSIDSNKI